MINLQFSSCEDHRRASVSVASNMIEHASIARGEGDTDLFLEDRPLPLADPLLVLELAHLALQLIHPASQSPVLGLPRGRPAERFAELKWKNKAGWISGRVDKGTLRTREAGQRGDDERSPQHGCHPSGT